MEERKTNVGEGCAEFLGNVEEGEAVAWEEYDGEDQQECDYCNVFADKVWQRGEAHSRSFQERRLYSRGRDWLRRRWHALHKSDLWHKKSHCDCNDVERQWNEADGDRISQETKSPPTIRDLQGYPRVPQHQRCRNRPSRHIHHQTEPADSEKRICPLFRREEFGQHGVEER